MGAGKGKNLSELAYTPVLFIYKKKKKNVRTIPSGCAMGTVQYQQLQHGP